MGIQLDPLREILPRVREAVSLALSWWMLPESNRETAGLPEIETAAGSLRASVEPLRTELHRREDALPQTAPGEERATAKKDFEDLRAICELLNDMLRHVPGPERDRNPPNKPPFRSGIPDAGNAILANVERLLRETVQSPSANAEPDRAETPPDLVRMSQVSGIVRRHPRTLRKLVKIGRLPPPDVKGRLGQAHSWSWARLRPALEREFNLKLPEIFHCPW